MEKGYKNKAITDDTKIVSNKKVKKTLNTYSFPGNPPVTIKAENRVEAEKKFNNLKK